MIVWRGFATKLDGMFEFLRMVLIWEQGTIPNAAWRPQIGLV